MASVVSIQIRVDNGQALPSIDQLNKALSDVGVKGTASFKQASDAADGMRGHISTGLDSVRLLSQEFGLRLPRAIESMLSRMPAVTTALGGILGAMAGIVALQVFAHLAEEAHRLYDEYVSLTAVQNKYLNGLDKARISDVGNTKSLETTRERLAIETQIAAQLHQQAAELASQPGWFHSGKGTQADTLRGHKVEEQATQADTLRDQLSRKLQTDDAHTSIVAQIELNHAKDAELVGQQKINAELQKKIQLDAEERRNNVAQERLYGNVTDPNSGASEQSIKNQTAQAQAQAQTDIAARESSLAIMKARDAATQAGLSGEELYFRKMQDDIRETTKALENQGKAAEIPANVREINEKYFAELADRQTKAQNETGLSIQRASSAGLTGAARINAEHDIQVNQINSNPQLVGSGQAGAARDAAATEQNQKLLALQEQFTEQMKALEDGRVESSLNGYARIDAAAQKEIDQVNKNFNTNFGGANPNDASTIAAEKSKQDAITSIQTGAAQQRQELTNSNNEETSRYDQQAAEAERRVREAGIMGWVASYRNGISEIEAQDAAQTLKLEDELAKRQIDETTFNKRKADVDAEANAQVEQQNQQMQQKIAGDLQEAFTNPVEFIKSQMEKMFFEIIAGWIMRMNTFKTLFGQTMGGLQPAAAGASPTSGSVMSAIGGGIPGTRGIVGGHPNISSIYGSAGSIVGTATGSSGTASATAAQVQSAGGSYHAPSSVGSSISEISSAAHTLGSLHSVGTPGASSDQGPDVDSTTMAGISDANAAQRNATAANGGASGTSSQIAGVGGAAMGAYTAEQTTVKAFETGNPLQGAVGDAAAGASIGMLAGPEGALIGAAVGAGVGASSGLLGMVTGEAGNLGARDYYEKNVLPTLEGYLSSSSGDYQSAVSQVGSTSAQAMGYMEQHFGQSAADWVNANYMQKEVTTVLSRIEDAAAGGRQYTTMSAAQFHTGGTISGFGSLGTSSNEGFIHAMLNETVMNTQASSAHAPMLSAMNSGASPSDVAAMYLAGATPSGSAVPQSGGNTHNWSVNALDGKSFSTFLKNGGAQQIVKHTNTYASQYAGDGISG